MGVFALVIAGGLVKSESSADRSYIGRASVKHGAWIGGSYSQMSCAAMNSEVPTFDDRDQVVVPVGRTAHPRPTSKNPSPSEGASGPVGLNLGVEKDSPTLFSAGV